MMTAGNNRSLWLLVASLPLLCGACATDKDFDFLQDQISALNTRVDRVQGATASDLDGKLRPLQETQAQMGVQIDRMRGDMQTLSGRVEEANHQIKRAGKDSASQSGMSDLSQRVAALEERLKRVEGFIGVTGQAPQPAAPAASVSVAVPATPPVAAAPTTAPTKPEAAQASKATSAEKEMYDLSLKAYNEGRYEEAITRFKTFVVEYPKSEYADNAQFWVGEGYMASKEYERAILAFQEVIKKYPKGNKVPGAMLRQAIAFQEIKDKMSATLLLKKIIKSYPNSPEAKIAEAKLKTL